MSAAFISHSSAGFYLQAELQLTSVLQLLAVTHKVCDLCKNTKLASSRGRMLTKPNNYTEIRELL